ncbi:MAG: PIN domain-containing protein [Kiritimatiellae bacterium]|nr:PIN domain-containing protein [Kiritimatiellia bacterium]
MKVLVDTSIWSLALRRREHAQNPEAEELVRLIASHVVEIIGPIRQEVLSGVRESAQFERLETCLDAFVDLTLTAEDYVTAAKFYNLCRAKGIQGSNTDFLICAVAVRHDLSVFTTDGYFPHFAKCLPIVLHEVRRPAEQSAVACGLPPAAEP